MCVRLRPFDIEARMGWAEQLLATGDRAFAAHVLLGVLALPVKDAATLDAHNSLGMIMDQSQAMRSGRGQGGSSGKRENLLSPTMLTIKAAAARGETDCTGRAARARRTGRA
jgi:hypothetical protein